MTRLLYSALISFLLNGFITLPRRVLCDKSLNVSGTNQRTEQ
jgi:hypothetical protein